MINDYEWKNAMVLSVAQYILEGHTDQETINDFGEDSKWLSIRKREIKEMFPAKYALITNKPYLVFQRMAYTGASLEEARKAFKVSLRSFDLFMTDMLKQLWEKNERRVYFRVKAVLIKAKEKA